MPPIIHFQELIIATFLLGMLPGSAVFATISCALQGRALHVIQLIAGILMGDILFASLAMTGLSTLILALPWLLTFVQLAGGLYLIYLGARAWPKGKKALAQETTPTLTPSPTVPSFLIGGFILTASNPKDLIFFVSFVPGFMDLSRASWFDILIASFTIAITFLVTLSFYAITATWARDKLASPQVRRGLDYAASIILVLLGLFMIKTAIIGI